MSPGEKRQSAILPRTVKSLQDPPRTKTSLAATCPATALSVAAMLSLAQGGLAFMWPNHITIANDPTIYECFPDVAVTTGGRLVVVYRESDSHSASAFTHLVWRTSDDGGRTWSPKHYLARSRRSNGVLEKWNCPRINRLRDGRLVVCCDRYPQPPGERFADPPPRVYLWFSDDDAQTFSGPIPTPVEGIVPDRLVELRDGTWLLAAHRGFPPHWRLIQRLWRSTDGGNTWQGPFTVADKEGLNLCEASIIQLDGGQLVAYMRENSGLGLPAFKSISRDGGRTWHGPFQTLIGGAHRPTAGLLPSGNVLVTYRYFPGPGIGKLNTFAYLESQRSALEPDRRKQRGAILPIDHDRSPKADTGYTGWVTLPGSSTVFVVNYIVDDAPMAQIRGYWLDESMF